VPTFTASAGSSPYDVPGWLRPAPKVPTVDPPVTPRRCPSVGDSMFGAAPFGHGVVFVWSRPAQQCCTVLCATHCRRWKQLQQAAAGLVPLCMSHIVLDPHLLWARR